MGWSNDLGYTKKNYNYSSETIIIQFPYSTVTDCRETTKFDKYVFCLVFIYRCKTIRFINHKKELIETCEYIDFDFRLRLRK